MDHHSTAPSARRRTASLVAIALLVVAVLGLAGPAAGDGSETLGPPSIDIAEGSGFAIGGTGMQSQPSTISVDVPAGATVEQVLLYWEGHFAPESGSADATIVVEGTEVTGTLIGGPTLFFATVHAAVFRADITGLGLVSPGANSLDVSGLDFSFRNNGAGVLVVFDDGTTPELFLRDGSDLAFHAFDPPLDTTVAQTYTFAPAPVDRTSPIAMFGASVADGENRPMAVDVTSGGVTTRFTDVFSSASGPEFDAVTIEATIPAGATTLTVQALSVGDGSGNNPASFNWLISALTVPDAPEAPSAPPELDCEEGVVTFTLTNDGQTTATFDVFRGAEQLNADPISAPPGDTSFTYTLGEDDEDTTVEFSVVASTGQTFPFSLEVDCLPEPPEGDVGATADLDCDEDTVTFTITNTDPDEALVDVFRGDEQLNDDPIAVPGGSEQAPGSTTFTYELRPEDENTTVDFSVVVPATETTIDIEVEVDCDSPPEPGATGELDCEEGVITVTLTNTGEEPTTFNVFKGDTQLNDEPILVGPGGSETFTYTVTVDDEDTILTLRAVADTGDEFDITKAIDCFEPEEPVLAANIALVCTVAESLQVTLTADAEEPQTLTITIAADGLTVLTAERTVTPGTPATFTFDPIEDETYVVTVTDADGNVVATKTILADCATVLGSQQTPGTGGQALARTGESLLYPALFGAASVLAGLALTRVGRRRWATAMSAMPTR